VNESESGTFETSREVRSSVAIEGNTSATTLTSRVERYTECSGFHRGSGGSSFQGSGDFRDAEFLLRKALQSMNFSCSPRTQLRNHGAPLSEPDSYRYRAVLDFRR